MADFSMDEIRAYRSCEVHGNAYRRPETYQLLLSQVVEPPFLGERNGALAPELP